MTTLIPCKPLSSESTENLIRSNCYERSSTARRVWQVSTVEIRRISRKPSVLSDCRRPLSTRPANITLSSQLPDLSRYLWATEKVSCLANFSTCSLQPTTPARRPVRSHRHPCHLITLLYSLLPAREKILVFIIPSKYHRLKYSQFYGFLTILKIARIKKKLRVKLQVYWGWEGGGKG